MKLVKPSQPNAWKLELRLEDFLSFIEADKFGVLKVDREDEYAPIIYADNQAISPTKKEKAIDMSHTPAMAKAMIF